MMRIRQASLRTDGKVAQNKDNSRGDDRKDLEANVYAESKMRVSVIEASNEDGGRNDTKERNCCENCVPGYYGLVAMKLAKSISHA